jgi:hypothetical protein
VLSTLRLWSSSLCSCLHLQQACAQHIQALELIIMQLSAPSTGLCSVHSGSGAHHYAAVCIFYRPVLSTLRLWSSSLCSCLHLLQACAQHTEALELIIMQLSAPPTGLCLAHSAHSPTTLTPIQVTWRFLSGDVHQALPAVRCLQEGGGCWPTRLHGVRHQVVSRPVQEPVLPFDVIAGKCSNHLPDWCTQLGEWGPS